MIESPFPTDSVHIAVVGDGTDFILYYNGVEAERISQTFPIGAAGSEGTHAVIGASYFSYALYDRNFKRKIDNLRIYTKALSPEALQIILMEDD